MTSPSSKLETWVRAQYRQRCCDTSGQRTKSSDGLLTTLSKLRPNEVEQIRVVIDKIHEELYEMSAKRIRKLMKWVEDQCRQFPSDETGGFQDKAAVIEKLMQMRRDCHPSRISEMVNEVQQKRICAFAKSQTEQAKSTLPAQVSGAFAKKTVRSPPAKSDLETWVYDQFLKVGFEEPQGFIGYKRLVRKFCELRPNQKGDIPVMVMKLRQSDYEFRFPDPASIWAQRKSQLVRDSGIPVNSDETGRLNERTTMSQKAISTESQQGKRPKSPLLPASPSTASATSLAGNGSLSTTSLRLAPESAPLEGKSSYASPSYEQPKFITQNKSTIINAKISALQASIQTRTNSNNDVLPENSQASVKVKVPLRHNHQLRLLLAKGSISGREREDADHDIRNAVLVSEDAVEKAGEALLPQYGLLGNLSSESVESSKDVADGTVFLNTNIPFSVFICGVQGSGKSHTVSCLLENCLIRSSMLGNLEAPLSALVFHFNEFTSRTSYNPSEVAFLSMAHRDFPDHPTAPGITIVVSPSNYHSLRQLYTQIPKVKVRPFKLQPQILDVGTMLMLMGVDRSQKTPLYMAQVTKILRDIATQSADGFDYLDFKKRLREQKFDRVQMEFLNQRLDLLESFLDLDGSCSYPLFQSGEITIVDLSCPFVDSNTACVLFKIAMRTYLGSGSTGKMIVLDEAHKYMIDTPAAEDLNESLLTVIRQQRHFGARVIISTQEPTISSQLIDLCAIVVIHRFTSPDWYNALKKHISISSNGNNTEPDNKELFRKILNLRTGQALVFAPTAVLGKHDTGEWIKATEELLRVSVRKRVTWDGGHSVVCV